MVALYLPVPGQQDGRPHARAARSPWRRRLGATGSAARSRGSGSSSGRAGRRRLVAGVAVRRVRRRDARRGRRHPSPARADATRSRTSWPPPTASTWSRSSPVVGRRRPGRSVSVGGRRAGRVLRRRPAYGARPRAARRARRASRPRPGGAASPTRSRGWRCAACAPAARPAATASRPTAPPTTTRSIAARGTWRGRDLGTLAEVLPEPGFGFGSTPPAPSVTTLVTTVLDARPVPA